MLNEQAEVKIDIEELRASLGAMAIESDISPLLPLLLDKRELKAGMIVFVGVKKVLFRPWPPLPRLKP